MHYSRSCEVFRSAIEISRKRRIRASRYHISSLYVTKKIHEINYLANFRAEISNGVVKTIEAPATRLLKTRVMVLEDGRIVFSGSEQQFMRSELKAIKEQVALDHHDHLTDPYFTDPWDKHRRPAEPDSVSFAPRPEINTKKHKGTKAGMLLCLLWLEKLFED
jgi:hypothetical protein